MLSPDEIRARRYQLGLSQPVLAALLGIDVMVLSKWERGVSEPALGRVLELALQWLDELARKDGKQWRALLAEAERRAEEKKLERLKALLRNKGG